MLPVPGLPVRPSGSTNEGPVTFTAGHHFAAASGDDVRGLAEAATAPLSVIVQVTKRCDFGCVFCSETLMMPDPTLDELDVIRARHVLDHGDLITGHQLSSDLAVLAAVGARAPHPGIAAAQAAWRQRRQHDPGGPRLLDTRYDAGHILRCASRRLVDVCADLNLDVTQPELRGTSMTALHRRWLEQADTPAREKITVLNLRHALSTALVAARAAGLASWPPGLNVNTMLAAGLDGALGWLNDPVFTALLEEPGAA